MQRLAFFWLNSPADPSLEAGEVAAPALLTRDTSGLTYHAVTQAVNDPRDREQREQRERDRGASGVAVSATAAAEADGKDAKKERVLHTRVPAVLERELKRFADNLRVPVSNLVRTILEDALSVADAATENVEERLKRAARHLEKEREKLKKRMEHDPLEGIVAFQEVTLAVPAMCAKCERELARGVRAHLGIGEVSGGPRRFVCEDCLPRT
jgi:hypothetical protein